MFAGYHPYNTYSYYDETKGIFLVTCNTEKDKNTFSSPSPSFSGRIERGHSSPPVSLQTLEARADYLPSPNMIYSALPP